MKKFYKICLSSIAVSLLSTGCSYHSSDPSKKEIMVGTYELKEYKRRNEDGDTYDYQKEIDAVAIFTVDEKGYGYYAYKDNKTPLFCAQTYSVYEQNEENPELFESITMTDGKSSKSAWEKYVGCMDEPTMGFQKNLFKKTYSYTIPYHEYQIYKPSKIQEYQYVCYQKVSSDTSINTLNEKLNASFNFAKPFELQYMSGFYAYTCQTLDGVSYANDTYDYMILDLDSYNAGNLTLYYSEKGSCVKQTTSVSVTINEIENSLNTVKLDVFGNSYNTYNNQNTLGTYFSLDTSNIPVTETYNHQFSKYYGQGSTIDEVIANLGK